MADSLSNYLIEIQGRVNDLMSEVGAPQLAFTKYVLEAMAEKGNLGEADACYAIIRSSDNKTLGEIFGYAKSLSGETISLFATIYEAVKEDDSGPKTVSSEAYNIAINRLQGYYQAAVDGRCNEMEPSADDYQICKFIYENADEITNIRLFVLSNGTIKPTFKVPKTRIQEKLVKFISWDINTLYSNLHSSSDHISVDIDLVENPNYPYNIPFIKMDSGNGDYSTYIAMLPGEFLYRIYEEFNTDLLQSNVRFFKGKKGCNKGIFNTLQTKPYRFLAYNNGITATSSEILADYNDDDQRTGLLRYIENFQILNGGQTTASIYYAKKQNPEIDLSMVFVQMKLIVINEDVEEFHPLITRYSNTQTSVTTPDYSTNHPFNQKLQELSRTILTPDPNNSGRVIRWYYERVSGQYDQDIAKYKTKAEKEKFKSENPSTHRFDKCELGKIYMAWSQKPYVSINGPQKCYMEFISEFKDKVPDKIFFEDFVAMLIIYRYMEKKNPVFLGYHQIKAQMIIYTLAMLYQVTNGNLSLYKIWQNQGLSDGLKAFIDELSKQLYQKLQVDAPQTSTFRDFCKSPKTWEATKKYILNLDLNSIVQDMKQPNEEILRRKSEQVLTERERKEVEVYGASFWDGLSRMATLSVYDDEDRRTMAEFSKTIQSGRILSPIHVFTAQKLLDKFRTLGLTKDEVIGNSSLRNTRKGKDSTVLYDRIQKLTDDDWASVKLVASRACEKTDAAILKKIAGQKDRSRLTYNQLVAVCRALDCINEKFGDKINKTF